MQAHGRPSTPLSGAMRAIVVVALAVGSLEYAYREALEPDLAGPFFPLLRPIWPLLLRYETCRLFVLAHPKLTATAVLMATAGLLWLWRLWLGFWHNYVLATLWGTRFQAGEDDRLPMKKFDLLESIARRPPRHTFVGWEPYRKWGLQRFRPVFIPPEMREAHRHILGKSGSGKTFSLMLGTALQDAIDGKGLVEIDAKADERVLAAIMGIARYTKREHQLKVFRLHAWNDPSVWTHTHNMLYVRPPTPALPDGGDVSATVDRVFSVLDLGKEIYYREQASRLFSNLCRALHGLIDPQGYGYPFVLRDVSICVNGVGSENGWGRALTFVLDNTTDREAAHNVHAQLEGLKKGAAETFAGLRGALAKFDSPIVNAYDPDIIMEDALERNELVYFQLPVNLYPLQGRAMGRAVIRDLTQQGGYRQVYRATRNQTPFSALVDEFAAFVDQGVVDALNKLRDAHVEFTLAHQTYADLESPELGKAYAAAVWDNTRIKEIMAQDNPQLCELVAKSFGTERVVEKTVRLQEGSLGTSLMTGDSSAKLVEAYKLHPNRIKQLAPRGQGYHYTSDKLRPVVYAPFPKELEASYKLPAKDQRVARGIRLYERFIAQTHPLPPIRKAASSVAGAPPPPASHLAASAPSAPPQPVVAPAAAPAPAIIAPSAPAAPPPVPQAGPAAGAPIPPPLAAVAPGRPKPSDAKQRRVREGKEAWLGQQLDLLEARPPPIAACRLCGKTMSLKSSHDGSTYWGCTGFPGCGYVHRGKPRATTEALVSGESTC